MTRSTALIALGSNLGDRSAHLSAALDAIAQLPDTAIIATSSIHETDPVGPPGQGPYLNAVCRIETAIEPRELLETLLDIERSRGRDRDQEQRWGSRTLDLDLILYADRVIDEPGLTLPHPRLHERAFVLDPAAEVASELVVPTLGCSIADLVQRLRASAPVS
ncbi:MAG: 2-amino-4-hydroxy-6-hydroxymethyldihydropteridine diphosphokinase [Planctomycetota bacterium]